MEMYIPQPWVQHKTPAPKTISSNRKTYRKQSRPISAKASKLSLFSISDHEEERSGQPRSHPSLPSPPIALTFLEWSRPTTKISVSAYSVIISTVYRGKPPLEQRRKPVNSKATFLLKSLPHKNQPRSKLILGHTKEVHNKAQSEGVGHRSSNPVKQPQRMVSISSRVLARETAKELDQTQKEFLQIRPLTKQAEPPPEVC